VSPSGSIALEGHRSRLTGADRLIGRAHTATGAGGGRRGWGISRAVQLDHDRDAEVPVTVVLTVAITGTSAGAGVRRDSQLIDADRQKVSGTDRYSARPEARGSLYNAVPRCAQRPGQGRG